MTTRTTAFRFGLAKSANNVSTIRPQIDREEVVLRRTIGLKKDEYFLDSKHVTKVKSVPKVHVCR